MFSDRLTNGTWLGNTQILTLSNKQLQAQETFSCKKKSYRIIIASNTLICMDCSFWIWCPSFLSLLPLSAFFLPKNRTSWIRNSSVIRINDFHVQLRHGCYSYTRQQARKLSCVIRTWPVIIFRQISCHVCLFLVLGLTEYKRNVKDTSGHNIIWE